MTSLIQLFKPKLILAADPLFGSVSNPTKYNSKNGEGLFLFLSNIFKLIAVIGGIFLIFQIIMAGFAYISASGDPKKTEAAWTKIWQSILGLLIIASAFIIAGVVERLTGINIINPVIYGPTN
ncbi:MAG: hypothetical protein Q8P53_02885 [Candidatus Shapirobacteria bacterium]|nr:hypothetical protein [Candidatus Shapirobacteria bacterium]